MSKYPRISFDRCKLIRELVKGKTVLDIGCVEHDLERRKRGHWLHDFIRQSAKSVVGLDYEVAEVEKLRREGYDVVVADATNFNLERTFDVIVAGELIEHVVNAGGFLESAKRHLKTDGQLILTTPNANCMIYALENLVLGREIDNVDHVCIYTPTTLKTLFEKCGMKLEAVVFIAENTSYCHESITSKALVQLKQLAQVSLGLLQPSLCHHMAAIARKAD